MTHKEEFEDTKGNQNEEEQTTQWPKDRRTNNTMAKRKSTKVQTTIYKIYTEI